MTLQPLPYSKFSNTLSFSTSFSLTTMGQDRRHGPTQGQWLQHQPLIRRLYIAEDKTLNDIRESLQTLDMKVTLVLS